MNGLKGQIVHLALLGVAAVAAFGVWSRDDSAQVTLKPSEVEVWGGSPDSVSLLTFDTPTRKLRIEPKKDDSGRYYVGTLEKDEPASPHPPAGADAGAPPLATKHETVRFVGVKAADEMMKSLAPLRAVREIGKVEPARAEEFGFDKPEGTLKLTVSGKAQSLVIGGSTPGGGERYAKAGSGDVYALPGDVVQNLLFAESRLTERDLQGFKPDEVTSVKIVKGSKSRDLTRVPNKVEGWADTATPTKLDETAGNWMSKLGRLHVQDWIEKPAAPVGPDNLVVSVAYFAGKKPLGTLELYKLPGEKG
ncbi:MAG TPA: DUF4340 domain-containing protein, partial [Polyangiaceae bacterium]